MINSVASLGRDLIEVSSDETIYISHDILQEKLLSAITDLSLGIVLCIPPAILNHQEAVQKQLGHVQIRSCSNRRAFP